MKKIISMLLVLTMIMTTLMGVMVIDVNAAVIDSCVVDDATGVRTWTITMNKKSTYQQNIATGKYIIKPTAKHSTGEESYDLGEITKVDNLGKSYWHLDFNDFVYKEGSTDKTNVLASGNYIRFRTDMEDTTGTTPAKTAILTSVSKDDFNSAVGGTTVDGKTTFGNVVKYTFYAYTQDTETESLMIQLNNTGSQLTSYSISPEFLYSENGIPHKVELYIWSDSKNSNVLGGGDADENVYIVTVVDGNTIAAEKSFAETATNATKATGFYPTFYVGFNPTTKSSITYKGSDWYVSHDDNTNYEVNTRENLDETAFVDITVPDSGSTLTFAKKADNVTGVVKVVDADLENVVAEKVDNVNKDKIINLRTSFYENPSSIFTGETTNVKLVDKKTGAEVASQSATGTMDDYFFMINGVYVMASKVDLVETLDTGKTVFSTPMHNQIDTRMWHEDYVNNSYPEDEKPFGGLTSGFYRYTNEPRSGIAFASGASMYNSDGYVSLNTYTGGASVNETNALLSRYNAKDNIATAEFDLYLPEYTAENGNSFRVTFAMFDGGFTSADRKSTTVYFTTDNLVDSSFNNVANSVNVKSNTWNTITMQFDFSNAANGGIALLKMYVNGELSKTISITGDYTDEVQSYFVPLAYLRFYAPEYVPFGVKNGGKWYMGKYTPVATPITDGVISTDDSKIIVDNENMIISSSYTTDEELLAAMPEEYTAVYASKIVDFNAVMNKYTELDGEFTENDSIYTHTGAIIKRFFEKTSYVTVENLVNENGEPVLGSNGEQMKKYTTKSNNVVSLTDNGDGTATVVLTKSFTHSGYVAGVCSNLKTIVGLIPEVQEDVLIGFAVVEEGKLPKVYSLESAGFNIRSVNYNDSTATLTYRKFGLVEGNGITFQLVVGAFNENGKLLELKAGTSTTINSATTDGENTITFAPGFMESTLSSTSYYKVFVLDSLVSARPVYPAVRVGK